VFVKIMECNIFDDVWLVAFRCFFCQLESYGFGSVLFHAG